MVKLIPISYTYNVFVEYALSESYYFIENRFDLSAALS